MRVVSNQHNEGGIRRVTRVQPINDYTDHETQDRCDHQAAPRVKRSPLFTGQSAIIAQVIASRDTHQSVDQQNFANQLDANGSYQAALIRKQVRLSAGSFLEEAA